MTKRTHLLISIAVITVCLGVIYLDSRSHPTQPPAPAFTPDPAVVQFVNGGNPFAMPTPPEPWLIADTANPNEPPGTSPKSTFLRSKAEPVITKDGTAWKIAFKP